MHGATAAERSLFLSSIDPSTKFIMDPHLREVTLKPGAVLLEPGSSIDYVHFPTHGVVSIMTVTKEGQTVETGAVGPEGVVGSGVVGLERSLHHAVVQVPGGACRLPSTVFVSACEQSKLFRAVVNRYNVTMWGMAQQYAACNALHALPSRIARWLLQCRARTGSDHVTVTQEEIATILGVQRTSVTTAECKFEREKIIRVRRGQVTILDLEALKERACECYQIDENRIARLASNEPIFR